MGMRTLLLYPAVMALAWYAPRPSTEPLRLVQTSVAFVSDASMERIEAHVDTASGLLDPVQRTFAIRIPVRAFQGFNSPLQREHFMENYLEAARFPHATFTGRIIETTDLQVDGTAQVRAKGTFTVHGVAHERVVPCELEASPSGVRVRAAFDVVLADHGIRIPKVVQQKLAPSVRVQADLRFAPAPR